MGSQITADVYARRLANFAEAAKVSPVEFAQLAAKHRRDLVLEFVAQETRRRMQGEYVRSTFKAINSWLEHNGLPRVEAVKIRGSGRSVRRENEELPSPEDVRAVRSAASLRDGIIVGLMAYSGLRPHVLGNYDGSDGVRLRDLPDLDVSELKFLVRPPRLSVRIDVSKNRIPFSTLIAGPVADAIEDYLRGRRAAGERLRPDSDLVHPIRARKPFLTAINVGDATRASFEAAGFKGERTRARWRPYILRHFFESRLAIAEADGKITHGFVSFLAGHKGDMDQLYALGRKSHSAEMWSKLREAYQRCEPYLLGDATSAKDVHATVRREMLAMLGYSEQQLDRLDFSDADAIRDFYRKNPPGATRRQQTTVAESEVDRLQAEGWTVRVQLLGGRVVMDPPDGGSVRATSPLELPPPNGGAGRPTPR